MKINYIAFHNTPGHFYISHSAPHLHPTLCITFVFHFSCVLQPCHEKLKTMLMQIRCIMGNVQVAYKHTQEVPSLGLISQRPSF